MVTLYVGTYMPCSSKQLLSYQISRLGVSLNSEYRIVSVVSVKEPTFWPGPGVVNGLRCSRGSTRVSRVEPVAAGGVEGVELGEEVRNFAFDGVNRG